MGLREVRAFGLQGELLPVLACTDPASSAALSTCMRLADGIVSSASPLAQYRSPRTDQLRVTLDFGADVTLARVDVYSFNVPFATGLAPRTLHMFVHDGATNASAASLTSGQAWSADVVASQRRRGACAGALGVARADGAAGDASPEAVADDRAIAPRYAASLVCVPCAPQATHSVWPRTSGVHCACAGATYSNATGHCVALGAALREPVFSVDSGDITANVTLVVVGVNASDSGSGSGAGDARVCFTLDGTPPVASNCTAFPEGGLRFGACPSTVVVRALVAAPLFASSAVVTRVFAVKCQLPALRVTVSPSTLMNASGASPLSYYARSAAVSFALDYGEGDAPLTNVTVFAALRCDEDAPSESSALRVPLSGSLLLTARAQCFRGTRSETRERARPAALTAATARAFHPQYFASATTEPLDVLVLQDAIPPPVALPVGLNASCASVADCAAPSSVRVNETAFLVARDALVDLQPGGGAGAMLFSLDGSRTCDFAECARCAHGRVLGG
jgi:hypothetical protein